MKEESQNLKRLFSLVALLFFPFAIKFLLDDNFELSDSDRKFVSSYQKAGWVVLTFVGVLLVLYILSFLYSYDFLFSIANILLIVVFVYLFVNIFFIFSDKEALFFSKSKLDFNFQLSSVQAGRFEYLLAYLPGVNYIFYKKGYNEYYFKEGILFSIALMLFGLLGFNSIFFGILLLMIVRLVSLFLGVEFLPTELKQKIATFFSKSPFEIFKFVDAFLFFIFRNLLSLFGRKKSVNYFEALNYINKFYSISYDVETILKKPKKYLFIILSYAIIFGFLLGIFYQNIWYYPNYVSIFSATVLFLFVYPYGKNLYPIPVLTLSLFYLLKIF